jgi:predicted GNAT family N-acyltransferase
MCTLESRALEEGASEVWLYARDTAIEFYLRLGYEPYGEPFVSELTGIVHIGVRKSL